MCLIRFFKKTSLCGWNKNIGKTSTKKTADSKIEIKLRAKQQVNMKTYYIHIEKSQMILSLINSFNSDEDMIVLLVIDKCEFIILICSSFKSVF